MEKITNPTPIFLDGRGALLDAGSIYIGLPNTDPLVPANQIALYTNQGLTNPIAQPLRTLGGVIVQGANKPFIYTGSSDYSMVVKDADGDTVYSVASVLVAAIAYQPLDADLTAIASNGVTSYALTVLSQPTAAAFKASLGITDSLPLTGGVVTGAIRRGGKGPHLFLSDPALTSGEISVSPASGGNPTTGPGAIWFGTT
jgi:hypothetical protein